MEVSPWKTPLDLYWDKVHGCENVTNFAMERGRLLEEEARDLFEEVVGEFVEPTVKIDDEDLWLGGSSDGWNPSGTLVEIKCPGQVDHNKAIEGVIPEKYYPQLQHLMHVFRVDKMYYFSYRPQGKERYAMIKVEKSPFYIERWYEKVSQFYECMRSKRPPEVSDFKPQIRA